MASERQGPRFAPAVIDAYVAAGWWGTASLAQVVAGHAARRPAAPAYIVADAAAPDRVLTWAQYDERSSVLAAILVQAGLEPGDRLAVILPDGATVHTAFLAAEKAGLVVVGVGARSGPAEIRHLLGRTAATALVTHGKEVAGGPGLRHIQVPDVLQGPAAPVLVDGVAADPPDAKAADRLLTGRALGPDDLFMINSTSGTTGLPKCVLHTQNRWFYFHQLAAVAGDLSPDDVFFGAVPAPFGFGLWTAHFSPAVLGSPTVVATRFDAAARA